MRKYRSSLFRQKLYKWESDTSRKIYTYVKNDGFYNNGIWDSLFEEWKRKRMGLTPVIYNGITNIGKDKYNWYSYSMDPLRDSVKTMSDRIILW